MLSLAADGENMGVKILLMDESSRLNYIGFNSYYCTKFNCLEALAKFNYPIKEFNIFM